MSQVEEIMYKAWEKGIQHETLSLAKELKKDNPKMEVNERYELAYSKAKTSLLKSSPPLNP
jgi:hypothetical protein